jgi:type I restriction enzyme R subunit
MAVFNEDTRVKIPATIQLMRIGYSYQSLNDAVIDFNTKIFINRFKPALEHINGKKYSQDEIQSILLEIHALIRNNDLGKEFYLRLINPLEKDKLIDFENISNNDFAVVDELPYCVVEGSEEGSFRPDINILINGIPLAFLEVKKPNNEGSIQKEFDRMTKDRLKNPAYKKFFNMIQFISFSNNMEYEDSDDAEDVKAGSFYSTPNGTGTFFSFFREDSKDYHKNYQYQDISEKTIKAVMKDCEYNPAETDTPEFQTNLSTMTPCNRFVTSVFDKERFIFLLHYGFMYVTTKNDEKKTVIPEKQIMRYPQFFATRKIIERFDAGGKGGIIWHTQGSGKTALAAYANRIIRDYYAKGNCNARFFFVVDRLELLRQASKEFVNRGFKVVNCNTRSQFSKELTKPLSTNKEGKEIGEMCVVNIQKFEDTLPTAKNEYDARIQRVFFVDEAHRSYKQNGDYLRNLMACDFDADYIALTGTPLLSKKERSNLKFGDYIHKYFYDKSIADGYTLRIKKEKIDTIAKSEIKQNLDIEDDRLDDKDVFESPGYVDNLCRFIEKDFNNFRLVNTDNSIGGMIVCRTNPQAERVHEWFCKNSKLVSGLVISKEGDPAQEQANKNNQQNFHDTLVPDILVVNMMLTTGYDVKRLKKMYLLRGPHAQALLQTISRVNRPYKSPTGKVYKFGYIVDFIDITEEYNKTVDDYIHELEADFNDDGESNGSLTGLVIDKETIKKKYDSLIEEIDDLNPTDNIEKFSKRLTMFNRDALYRMKHLLNDVKSCETEFVLSRAIDYVQQTDPEKSKKLLRTVQERIDFLNLSTKSVDMMNVISNKEIVEILYEFIKTKVTILDLSKLSEDNPKVKKFTDIVTKVQNEVKKNKNKDDIKISKLDELLQQIFQKLNISDLTDLDDLTEELEKAYEEAKAINEENERLAAAYGGNYAFVKTYQDACINYTKLDRSAIEKALKTAYEDIKDNLDNETLTIQGKQNFIDSVKHNITKILLREGLYGVIKDYYDQMLGSLYTNLQLFK